MDGGGEHQGMVKGLQRDAVSDVRSDQVNDDKLKGARGVNGTIVGGSSGLCEAFEACGEPNPWVDGTRGEQPISTVHSAASGPPSYHSLPQVATLASLPPEYRSSLLLVDPSGHIAGVSYDPRQSTSDISLHTIRWQIPRGSRRSCTSATATQSFFTALEGGTVKITDYEGLGEGGSASGGTREDSSLPHPNRVSSLLHRDPTADPLSSASPVAVSDQSPTFDFDIAGQAEAAFWHLVMPSASAISSAIGYLTQLFTTSDGWRILHVNEHGRTSPHTRRALV